MSRCAVQLTGSSSVKLIPAAWITTNLQAGRLVPSCPVRGVGGWIRQVERSVAIHRGVGRGQDDIDYQDDDADAESDDA